MTTADSNSPDERALISDEPSRDPQRQESVLCLEKFSKSYEGTLAVDQLSFAVQRGEILGLVGPNGAGKTTTLRSVAGILPVRSGRILVCGYDLSRHETEAKQCLAWIPDNPQPFDALTVEEHLRFTAALYGIKGWRARADELLQRFELTEKRRALGGELSRGMRQKLAFCCAWLPRPRLVLMDEPLSGLDPRGIRSAKEAILELASEGTAVILSSHLLELVEELGDRLLIMDRGRRMFLGTLQEARDLRAGGDGVVQSDQLAGASLEEVFLHITGSDATDVRADTTPGSRRLSSSLAPPGNGGDGVSQEP